MSAREEGGGRGWGRSVRTGRRVRRVDRTGSHGRQRFITSFFPPPIKLESITRNKRKSAPEAEEQCKVQNKKTKINQPHINNTMVSYPGEIPDAQSHRYPASTSESRVKIRKVPREPSHQTSVL